MILARIRRCWQRAHRFSFTRRKISRPLLTDWVSRWATAERTLVIHPEFALDLFPNKVVVSKRAEDHPDILVECSSTGCRRSRAARTAAAGVTRAADS